MAGRGLVRASVRDTGRVLGSVVAPIVAQGVIARRPRMVALAGLLGADDRAVRTLQGLRDAYGAGPLRLAVPGRSVAVLLDADDVRRVLLGSPEPFAAANWEKRGALRHFQPHGVLVSHGEIRAKRRSFNEAVLDTGRPLHRLAEPFVRVARQEAMPLRDGLDTTGVLDWDGFITAWWRAVRRIALGDGARDDHETTDLLSTLRAHANWSGLRPRRADLRSRFAARLQAYAARAEPGCLAALVAAIDDAGPLDGGGQMPPVDGVGQMPPVDGVGQMPQWLFAFDAAGIATYRALALLAAHREQAARVHAELAGLDLRHPQDLPLLRASVLESVRLWPTTPVVLRDTTEVTGWEGGSLPAGTGLLIVSAFFHRDDETLTNADRFDPDQWLDGRGEESWSLIPFSAGPVVCPGRELVLLTASAFLATLLEHRDVRLPAAAPLGGDRPLPRALDPFRLRFAAG